MADNFNFDFSTFMDTGRMSQRPVVSPYQYLWAGPYSYMASALQMGSPYSDYVPKARDPYQDFLRHQTDYASRALDDEQRAAMLDDWNRNRQPYGFSERMAYAGRDMAETLPGLVRAYGRASGGGLGAITDMWDFAESVADSKWAPAPAKAVANEAVDFFNYGSTSVPVGITDTWTALADLMGDGPPISINPYERTRTRGSGVGQMMGQMADDIAYTVGGGLGASWLLEKMGVSAAPWALQLGGRTIGPAASWAQRLGFGLAGAAGNANSSLPAYARGDISTGQLLTQSAVEGAGNAFGVGVWGNKFWRNVLGDMANNTVANAASSAVPLAFGQPGYTWQHAAANTLTGTAIGGGFGLAGNISPAARGTDPSLNFGAKTAGQSADANAKAGEAIPLTPEQVQATQAVKVVEERLFGSSTISDAMDPTVAAEALKKRMAEDGVQGMVTLARDPNTGAVSSLSDAVLRGQVVDGDATGAVDQAARMERRAYASKLASMYPPEVLTKLLDLNTAGMPLSRSELAAKIENEWLNQASNGMGIEGVERRLMMAGLESPIPREQATQTGPRPGEQDFVGPVEYAGPPTNPNPPAPAPRPGEAGFVGPVDPMGPPVPAGGVPAPEGMIDYRVGGQQKMVGIAGESPSGMSEGVLPNADIRTDVPPSIMTDPVSGPAAKAIWQSTPQRSVANRKKPRPGEIVVWQDPATGEFHTVDGGNHIRGNKDAFHRSGFYTVRDKVDGRLKDITVDDYNKAPKRYDVVNNPAGNYTRVSVLQGSAADAIKERIKRNPELRDIFERRLKESIVGTQEQTARPTETGTGIVEQAKADGDVAKDSPVPDGGDDVIPDDPGVITSLRTAMGYSSSEFNTTKRAINSVPPPSEKEVAARNRWYNQRMQDAIDGNMSKQAQQTARKSYQSMERDLVKQAAYLTNQGYVIEVVDGPPYLAMSDFMRDMANRHIRVQRNNIDSGPMAKQTVIKDKDGVPLSLADLLDATHLVYGHGSSGAAFDIDGIEQAWGAHAPLMARESWPAFATETRIRRSIGASHGNDIQPTEGKWVAEFIDGQGARSREIIDEPDEFMAEVAATERAAALGLELDRLGPVGMADEFRPAVAAPAKMSTPPGVELTVDDLASLSSVSDIVDVNVASKVPVTPDPQTARSTAARVASAYKHIHESVDVQASDAIARGNVSERQVRKAAIATQKSLADFVAGREPMVVKTSEGAKKFGWGMKLIAEVEGLTPTEINTGLMAGRTEFWDGKVKADYDAENGTVTFEVRGETVKTEDLSAAAVKTFDDPTMSVDEKLSVHRRMSDDGLTEEEASLRDAFEIDVARERAEDPGLVALREELLADLEGGMGEKAKPLIQTKGSDVEAKDRIKYGKQLKSKLKLSKERLEMALRESDRPNRLSHDAIDLYFTNIALAGQLGKRGEVLMSRYADDFATIQNVIEGDPKLQKDLISIANLTVPEKGFNPVSASQSFEAFSNRLFKFEEQAIKLAGKYNLEPKRMMDLLASEGGASIWTNKVPEMQPILKAAREDPEFAKAVEDFMKIKATNTWDQVSVRHMMQPNATRPDWNVRNIAPGLAMGGGYLMLDQYISDLEDDQTYLGIPGSIWKETVHGGAGLGLAGFGIGGWRSKTRGQSTGASGQRIHSADALRRRASSIAATVKHLQPDAAKKLLEKKYLDLTTLNQDEFAAAIRGVTQEKYPDMKGAEFEEMVAKYAGVHMAFAGDAGQILDKAGSIDDVIRKFPAVEEFIGRYKDISELRARDVAQIHDELRELIDYNMKKYGDDASIVDAVEETDRRLSAISLLEEDGDNAVFLPEQIQQMRDGVREDIKQKYFSKGERVTDEKYKNIPSSIELAPDVAGPRNIKEIDAEKYQDFLDFQATIDKLREKDMRSLVASSLRVPEYRLDELRDQLDMERRILIPREAILDEQIAKMREKRGILLKQKKELFVEAELAGKGSPEMAAYEEALSAYEQASKDADRAMRQRRALKHDLDDIKQRIEKINSIPDLVKKSKENGYIRHVRDQKAHFILRISDKATGAEIRLEESTMADAEATKVLQVQQILAKRGIKGTDEMAWDELVRLVDQDGKITFDIYNNRGNARKRALRSVAAQRAITAALESASSLEARMNKVTTMGFKSDEISAESIADALQHYYTDMPVNRTELVDYLNKKVLSPGEKVTEGNTEYEMTQIDMAELRRIARRFTDPPIPSLSRRKNVQGYYNPKGDWSTARKWKFLADGFEQMQTNVVNSSRYAEIGNAITKLSEHLDKYNVNNGLREWLSDWQAGYSGHLFPKSEGILMDAAHVLRAMGTGMALLINNTAAVANALYGRAALAMTLGTDMMLKPGARRIGADGSVVETHFFKSHSEREDFLRSKGYGVDTKGGKGSDWIPYNVASYSPLRVKQLARATAIGIAPRAMLKHMARTDPRYRVLAERIDELNLKEATLVGSIADQGFETSRLKRGYNTATWALTRRVEESNSLASVIAFADDGFEKMGLSPIDFDVLSRGQQTDAVKTVLRRSDEFLDMQSRLMADDLEVKEAAIKDVEKFLYEEVLVNAIRGRRMSQGDYTPFGRPKIEQYLRSNWWGALSLTMTVPVIRNTNMIISLLGAAAREKGVVNKLNKAAPVIFGTSLLAALMGYEAAPLAGDIGAIEDMIYEGMHAIESEDEKALGQLSKRQRWEERGAALAERLGLDPEKARKGVRYFWSDGLIRSITNVSIGNEGALFSTVRVPGADYMWSKAKGAGRFFSDIAPGSNVTTGEAFYKHMNLFGTQVGRVGQSAVQTIAGEKLTPYGNTMLDPKTGKPIPFTVVDGGLWAAFGRPWDETRSATTFYEGGVPMYTDEDKHNYAMTVLKGTPILQFKPAAGVNEEIALSAMVGKVPEFDQTRRTVWQEHGYGERMQFDVERAKESINDDQVINLPPQWGGPKTVTQILSTLGSRNQYDYGGKGLPSARKQVMKDIQDYYVAQATADAVNQVFGGQIPMRVTNEDFLKAPDGLTYATVKMVRRYGEALGYLESIRQGYGLE